MPENHIHTAFAELAIPVDETFTAEQAWACAALVQRTRSLGLSLGDRVCLAVAASRNSTALTTDRRWSRVAGPNLKIQLVR